MAGNSGFSADVRLRQTSEFGNVFAERRLVRGRQFNLHYRASGGVSARLGLVIAKKLARRSVWRNAIRRICREAFRTARVELPQMDLVLRLAKPVTVLDAEARRVWRQEIDALLLKLPR